MPDVKPTLYATVSEFLDALRLKNWISEHDNWRSSWHFRGHGDAKKWTLTPTAWRWHRDKPPASESDRIILTTINKNRKMIDSLIKGWFEAKNIPERQNDRVRNMSLLIHQAYAEHSLIQQFRVMMNDLGLPTYDYHSSMKNAHDFVGEYIDALNDRNSNTQAFWVSTSIGLAQHHGIPTRLLDWTKNPLAAAYFAAESAQENAGHIAVIAVHRIYLENNRIGSIYVPNNASDYIRAQSGLFTLDLWAEDEFLNTGFFPSLEQITSNESSRGSINNNMKKLILPTSEVEELLRLLWLEGITRAHLMPTTDNIVKSLKIKWEVIDRL